MKHAITCLALISAMAVLPVVANATMTDAEATAAVQDMLIARKSSEEVLGFLIKDGRSLKDATVLAVNAVSGHAKVNLARVGICMAQDNDEAEAIGTACVDVCAPATDPIIEKLVQNYITGGCEKPDKYGSASIPSEGSVSPSF
jgi:hypothetical protein